MGYRGKNLSFSLVRVSYLARAATLRKWGSRVTWGKQAHVFYWNRQWDAEHEGDRDRY